VKYTDREGLRLRSSGDHKENIGLRSSSETTINKLNQNA